MKDLGKYLDFGASTSFVLIEYRVKYRVHIGCASPTYVIILPNRLSTELHPKIKDKLDPIEEALLEELNERLNSTGKLGCEQDRDISFSLGMDINTCISAHDKVRGAGILIARLMEEDIRERLERMKGDG